MELRKSTLDLEEEKPELFQVLSETLPLRKSQVVWAMRHEIARSVEDMLARRVRGLFLDAKETLRVAEPVTELMAQEMGKDKEWIDEQLEAFNEVAANYLIKN